MIYLDTSALVKLYFPEPETAALTQWLSAKDESIIFTSFHNLEFNNTLSLKKGRNEIAPNTCNAVLRRVEHDLQEGVLYSPEVDWEVVFSEATKLAQAYTPKIGSRSLDIIHVASLIVLGNAPLITFDARQRKLAEKLALQVISI